MCNYHEIFIVPFYIHVYCSIKRSDTLQHKGPHSQLYIILQKAISHIQFKISYHRSRLYQEYVTNLFNTVAHVVA